MNMRIYIVCMFLLTHLAYANDGFFLKPNETTSFMNFELHNLAYEAASKKDYTVALRLYTQLANKGDNRAEYNLGMMYMNGLGVDVKKMDAYKWLRRASKHGNEEATLYFKQMNERYEKKHQQTLETKEAEAVETKSEPIQGVEEKEPEPKPVVTEAPKPAPVPSPVQELQNSSTQQDDNLLMYIIGGIVGFVLILGLFLLRKSTASKPKPSAQEGGLRFKSQIYDITYKNIADYHQQLLKQLNLPQIKAHDDKKQIYYMFLYGMIDYFCQLEKFTDAEQRRIVSTHFAQQEGKENVTAITKLILEGQKDHSMYHYQAAGGISAKAWHADRSTDIMGTLKRLLSEHKSR